MFLRCHSSDDTIVLFFGGITGLCTCQRIVSSTVVGSDVFLPYVRRGISQSDNEHEHWLIGKPTCMMYVQTITNSSISTMTSMNRNYMI